MVHEPLDWKSACEGTKPPIQRRPSATVTPQTLGRFIVCKRIWASSDLQLWGGTGYPSWSSNRRVLEISNIFSLSPSRSSPDAKHRPPTAWVHASTQHNQVHGTGSLEGAHHFLTRREGAGAGCVCVS